MASLWALKRPFLSNRTGGQMLMNGRLHHPAGNEIASRAHAGPLPSLVNDSVKIPVVYFPGCGFAVAWPLFGHFIYKNMMFGVYIVWKSYFPARLEWA